MKGDFLAYFKEKAEKKNCKWEHVYKHFERFCNGKCRFDEINVDLCNKFREYLMTAPQTIHTTHKLQLFMRISVFEFHFQSHYEHATGRV